ncbi:uncharacterized protein srcap [Paramormyrops kingsleyae]|uniref:uncharacterized protein srcap n=1 Tax=Paramormyrops kingsleyae TaxID=1676925 RepID=UPI003B974E3E
MDSGTQGPISDSQTDNIQKRLADSELTDCQNLADVQTRQPASDRPADSWAFNAHAMPGIPRGDTNVGPVDHTNRQTDTARGSPVSREGAEAPLQLLETAGWDPRLDTASREELDLEPSDKGGLCDLSHSDSAGSPLLATSSFSTDHSETVDMDKSQAPGQDKTQQTSQLSSESRATKVSGPNFLDPDINRQVTEKELDQASRWELQNTEQDSQCALRNQEAREQTVPATVESESEKSTSVGNEWPLGEYSLSPELSAVPGGSCTDEPQSPQPTGKCWTAEYNLTGDGNPASHNAADTGVSPQKSYCCHSNVHLEKSQADKDIDTETHPHENLKPSLGLQSTPTSQSKSGLPVNLPHSTLDSLVQREPTAVDKSGLEFAEQEVAQSCLMPEPVDSSETGICAEGAANLNLLLDKDFHTDLVSPNQSICDLAVQKSGFESIIYSRKEIDQEVDSEVVIRGENDYDSQTCVFPSDIYTENLKEPSVTSEERSTGKELENHLPSPLLSSSSNSSGLQEQSIPKTEVYPKTSLVQETWTPSKKDLQLTKMETKEDSLEILLGKSEKGSGLHAEETESSTEDHRGAACCTGKTLTSAAVLEFKQASSPLAIEDSKSEPHITDENPANTPIYSIGHEVSAKCSPVHLPGEAFCISEEGGSPSAFHPADLMIREGPELTVRSEVFSDDICMISTIEKQAPDYHSCLTLPSMVTSKVETLQEKADDEAVFQGEEVKTEVCVLGDSSSSGLVDSKLFILNLDDTPLLKHSPIVLGGGLQNVEAAHSTSTELSSPACGTDMVSVECLSQTVTCTDSVPVSAVACEKLIDTDPANSEPSSYAPDALAAPVIEHVQMKPCLSTSFPLMHSHISYEEALAEIEVPTENTHEASQSLLTPTSISTTVFDSIQSSLYHTSTNEVSHHSDLSQLPAEILQSEHTDWSVVSQVTAADNQASPPEQPSTPSGESSDSDVELPSKSPASSSRFAITPSSQSKTSQVYAQIDRPYVPLRGPHGKFISPSMRSPGGPHQPDLHRHRTERQTDMAELAKHEADIEHRTLALKREGFWSLKRLSRVAEPCRPKVHWDYLCEEMQWLSADFAQERRWKRGVARKVVRMVMRYHEEQRQKEEKSKKEEQAKLRRVASSIAKEVRAFWSSVEKVVQFKQQSRLEEKRKKALDLQLDFIVGQTERYSDLLSQSLGDANVAVPLSVGVVANSDAATTYVRAPQHVVDEDDGDFEPPFEEDDDEETIEVEEQQEGNDAETHKREIELLRQEGTLPLDQLLHTLTHAQDKVSEESSSTDSSSAVEDGDGDEEFSANEDSEDEEETIAAQEVVEGEADHTEELSDLAKEGALSVEELLEKYRGAYEDDGEASPSTSQESSEDESEVSEEGEEDSRESDSDAESRSSSDSSAAVNSADEGGEGMEILLKGGDHSPPGQTTSRPKKEISHIAATAESLQPKGYTLATTQVKTPIPFLLHGTLREYQHIGLDWLVTMYEKKLNGILADEMGLGKTIQTIALLAHLACEKGNWGPHLIIVPTSVMLNWEMELKRWCPSFKILTYYGSQKERRLKRQGWTKPNAFHVCITSYKLVLQDHQAFRRKSWRYLILDEAQNIKNFKSQRWQSLLNFNSQRRLLLTGTPLQNSLMELWSLMHFLMPHVFQSHREFKEWFSNPLTGMIEGSQEYNEGLIKRLHKVLRPFLLRRIKVDVEKQMPKKYEHVVRCRLSKRQRFLYDDFMAQASTRETLASGHFMSVINILMQLRKVCNHPDLFDPRPIHSPFITSPILFTTASLVLRALERSPFEVGDVSIFDLVGLEGHVSRYQADVFLPRRRVTPQLIQEIMDSPNPPPRPKPVRMKVNRMFQPVPRAEGRTVVLVNNPRPPGPLPAAPAVPRPPLAVDLGPAAPATTPAPLPAPINAASHVAVCSVAPTNLQKASVSPCGPAPMTICGGVGAAVRPGAPVPILTVRPPAASSAPSLPGLAPSPSSAVTQRVLLSPDMQARLPSGEVVTIAQLASLAGRPLSSSQGSKPVTFQLQGNKLTLSGAQLHQVTMAQPRSIQVPSSMVTSSGIVKIVMRPSTGKEAAVPTPAVPPPTPCTFPSASPVLPHTGPSATMRPPALPLSTHRLSTPLSSPSAPCGPISAPLNSQIPRPILKVLPGPSAAAEPGRPAAPPGREDTSDAMVRVPAPPSSATGGQSAPRPRAQPPPPPRSPFYMSWLDDQRRSQREERLARILRVNELHCGSKPIYGTEVLDFLTFLPQRLSTPTPVCPGDWHRTGHAHCLSAQLKDPKAFWVQSKALRGAMHTTEERLLLLADIIDRYIFVIPSVEAPPITMHCCHPPPSLSHQQTVFSSVLRSELAPPSRCLHRIHCNMRTHFPDLRLIQYDCGKLQTLHSLLRKLKTGGHRVLIFTQMTRMLDVLEQFLNYHGHIYLRLDGSTRVEQRQALMERFNADRRIFCFILSTRSGGVGVNLTGADTVVFYDSDWNPTMDAQAQDRCHRIGQTRDVHIYRLISERTVEENILKKANQKRMLGDMAIEGGNFTTAFFKQQTIRELFFVSEGEKREAEASLPSQPEEDEAVSKQHATILEQALCRAEDEEDIVAASQAKAEQVAELAEFNESIPLEESNEGMGRDQEEEELSKAEQEIAALVEQLTPIERYAMNFLEASLEDVCKEELKQAEEQVEAARKGLDQAKEEVLKLPPYSDMEDEELCPSLAEDLVHNSSNRRPRKHKEKGAPSTRVSGRLRGPMVIPEANLSTNLTHAEIAQHKEKGSESHHSEQDASSSLSSQQQCHGAAPSLSNPKQDEPVLTTNVIEDVSSFGCALPVAVGPKELSVSSVTSLAGVNLQSVQSHSQHHPAIPKVTEPATSGVICCTCSASESSSRAHLTTSSPTSSLVLSTALTPTVMKTHINQTPCASSTSYSVSGEKINDQGQTDYDGAPADTENRSEVTQDLSASSGMDSIGEGHFDSAQIQDSDVTMNEENDPHIQRSLNNPSQLPTQSPLSRSPRKRQSADGEVLSSHVDDSPSAKVLRKLPGRLVTVVEEKEPRRRKRAAGGGQHDGKGQEMVSADLEQGLDVLSKEAALQTQDKTSATQKENRIATQVMAEKASPQHQPDQNQTSPSLYHDRAVIHSTSSLSPDMPVLRNLPVRRRLETESRMAAQLGEHQAGRGRGRGVDRRFSLSPSFPKKVDTKLEGAEEALNTSEDCTFTPPKVNITPPGKRKRGRPPKTPPRVNNSATEQTSSCDDVATEGPGVLERSPSPSPKRKRGRPRKEIARTSTVETSCITSTKNSSLPGSPDFSEHSENFTTRNNQPAYGLEPQSPLPNNNYPLESISPIDTSQSNQIVPTSLSPTPQSNEVSSPLTYTSKSNTENQHVMAKVEEDFKDGDSNMTSVLVGTMEEEQDKETKSKDTGECKVECKEDQEDHSAQEDCCTSQPKKRRVAACLSGDQGSVQSSPRGERDDDMGKETQERTRTNRHSVPMRPGSRRSSQESACSSSPSSISSRSTSTYSSLSRKDDATDRSMKRKQKVDANKKEGTAQRDPTKKPSHSDSASTPQQCSFSCSSSDSDDSSAGHKERRLTRSTQKMLESGDNTDLKGNLEVRRRRRGRKSIRSPCREGQLMPNTTTRTEGETKAEMSVRVTRKSSGPLLASEQRQQPSPVSPSTVSEVLGKRCSALNAAAKLLAMRSKGGNPGSSIAFSVGKETPKGGRAKGQYNASASSERSNKAGVRGTESKTESNRQLSGHPNPTASRSTRQRPGDLVPPLQTENKRNKVKRKRMVEGQSKGEESHSPRAHSACSSLSSEQGEGSSRSRSSSNSSQRTHSLSSQSTGPLCSQSRAPSPSSDRERRNKGDKAGERSRGTGTRESRKERRLRQEKGSGEGTPDRLLRSVAALAAAQARTPASNTRSSTSHHHACRTKT